MSILSLKNMIKPEQAAEIDYPGLEGFTVTLNYLGRDKLTDIRKACVTKKLVKGQLEENLDFEKFNKLYSAAVIKGWKGFKMKYLTQLLLADLPDGVGPEDELEFTPENAEELLRHASDFDSFVSSTLADLSNFTKRG